jgi:outer membrane protein assembly factor BamE (lipoprotein component of BamABCDE complex)
VFKPIVIIGFLSLLVPFNSHAHDGDRIDQLEKEIQETKLRILKLESLLSTPSTAQIPVTSGEGWKSVTSWRKLANGMSTGDVRKLLGEPHRLDGGSIANWYYENGGRITFYNEKVDRWTEPRQ